MREGHTRLLEMPLDLAVHPGKPKWGVDLGHDPGLLDDVADPAEAAASMKLHWTSRIAASEEEINIARSTPRRP